MHTAGRAMALAAGLMGTFVFAQEEKKEEKPKLPPIKMVVVTGAAGHDWRASTALLKESLGATGRFTIEVIEKPESELTAERLADAAVIVLNHRGAKRWPAAAEKALLDAVNAGKGLVVLHHSANSFAGRTVAGKTVGDWPEYTALVAGGWRSAGSALRPFQYRVELPDTKHAIVKELPETFLHVKDELHVGFKPAESAQVIATVDVPEGGGKQAVAWVGSYGKGRVFQFTLGHGLEPMKGLGFLTILARGAEWAGTGAVTLEPPGALDAPEGR